MDELTPEEFFAGGEDGIPIYRRVKALVDMAGTGVTVRASKSQMAFRRGRHGFAYLWRPGQYLRNPASEVVLSIALPRRISSDRFKEVVHPAPTVWMHHLEIRSLDDLDDEVTGWLREAADGPGAAGPANPDRTGHPSGNRDRHLSPPAPGPRR